MAESVLTTIAGEIIKKAGSIVLQEIEVVFGVKDELEKLRSTVTTIKAVLLDAEEQYWENNHQVRTWLAKLREVLYDADDLLDDFSTMALQREAMTGNKTMQEVNLFFSRSNQIVYGLKMGHKIKDLRVRLKAISADRRDLHLVERPTERPVILRRREQTHSSLPEIFIGREEDKKKIVEFLLGGEENLTIFSIVGFGGLGKTTLAQSAYNDYRVRNLFEQRGWVCVSDNFDVKLIVEKLLESLTGERHSNCEMERLKNLLHQKISGKKFLIMLDDVWDDNKEEWFRLRDLLVGGAEGSKLVITTRIETVASVARSNLIYKLQGLSPNESWSLFERIAFKEGQVPSPTHESIGKEIVAKCGGVPLALRSIGGLLYCKHTIAEWKSFRDNELLKVKKDDILGTLRLSYTHLPSHLKYCFAYCSLFPKDYEIEVETLIHLWIAQGNIELSDSSQSFEETGYGYFMDLLSMSFFQEVDRREVWGNIVRCKMHDLMHDLAKSVAGEEIITLEKSNEECIGKSTRHVSIVRDGDINFFSDALYKAGKARTFLYVRHWWRNYLERAQFHGMFSKLKYLRMLDVSGPTSRVNNWLDSIGKLKHLRYLNLSDNEMERLPDSITRLWNLQVLKLCGCDRLENLPENIYKLVNLLHLGLAGCSSLTHMPVGIGKLISLEHLSTFVVGKDRTGVAQLHECVAQLYELHLLNKLRGRLEISNLRYAGENDCQAANLKEKEHLQCLILDWSKGYYERDGDYYEMSGDEIEKEERALEALRPRQNLKGFELYRYRGVKSPSWLPSLSSLVHIRIGRCENIRYLPAMDHLPSLQRLSIIELTHLEYIETMLESSFFASLKDLHIRYCVNLKGWSVNSESTSTAEQVIFHCLRNFSKSGCPKLDVKRDANSRFVTTLRRN